MCIARSHTRAIRLASHLVNSDSLESMRFNLKIIQSLGKFHCVAFKHAIGRGLH